MSEAVQLAEFIARHGKLVVVTGAGCSTDSGIGDYRDAAGRWKHTTPIQYAEFIASAAARRRYWARSLLGWPQFSQAKPNLAHRSLVRLERARRLGGLITQNVDRLHQRAGHQQVLDLHGRLDQVSCLDCKQQLPRARLQQELSARNATLLPGLRAAAEAESRQAAAQFGQGAEPAPDGDARVTQISTDFSVPDCRSCGGLLKPDVVFYGQSVPKPVVEQAYGWVAAADALLVVGSSLMVFSSYRFARAAAAANTPIVILNQGVTRADELASLKLTAGAGTTLAAAVDMLHKSGSGEPTGENS